MVSPLFLVCLVLVFVCSLIVLEQIEGFSGGARWVIAACVALLSASGLTSGSADGSPSAGSDVDGILLPYAALGLTLIVLLILYVLARLLLALRAVKLRLLGRSDSKGRAPSAQVAERPHAPAQDAIDHSRMP